MVKATSFFSLLLATCEKRKRLLALFAAIFLLYRFRRLYKKYLIYKLAKKIKNDSNYGNFRIVIFGAGFAGIGMAIKLKQHGSIILLFMINLLPLVVHGTVIIVLVVHVM